MLCRLLDATEDSASNDIGLPVFWLLENRSGWRVESRSSRWRYSSFGGAGIALPGWHLYICRIRYIATNSSRKPDYLCFWPCSSLSSSLRSLRCYGQPARQMMAWLTLSREIPTVCASMEAGFLSCRLFIQYSIRLADSWHSSSGEFHYQRMPVPELWLVEYLCATRSDWCLL
jgi:hypothetical protein